MPQSVSCGCISRRRVCADMINQDQFLSMLRSILAVVGGWAVSRGYVTADQVVLVGGLLASLVPLAWGIAVHTNKAKVAAAQAVPAAQVAVSDPALASPGVIVASPGAETVTVPVPKPAV